LLHRFGIDESHDPYNLIETLPLSPGGKIDVDAWRRRLLTYLTDARTIRERFKNEAGGPPPYWLIVLDDVHHMEEQARDLLGALLQISTKAPLRLLFISRTTLKVYDRRDVHTRNIVKEFPISGLSLEETKAWLDNLDNPPAIKADEVHAATGGHPLALELLELYGQPTHGDWLRFLDEEILTTLPEHEQNLLATLALAKKPMPWEQLADAVQWEGKPPQNLLKHGLLIDLEEGMWLHEALRERLLREVGSAQKRRKERLGE
jgi:DNA-binding transcriptional MerR regulator